MSEAVLFSAKVYVNSSGEFVFEYEAVDPQELKKSVLKDTDAMGAWRVVDRLKACSEAIDRDWRVIVGG